jgi:hypothetical protein
VNFFFSFSVDLPSRRNGKAARLELDTVGNVKSNSLTRMSPQIRQRNSEAFGHMLYLKVRKSRPKVNNSRFLFFMSTLFSFK